MSERNVQQGNFVIEKSYAVAPGTVFAAFTNAERKRRWFGGPGVTRHELDFRPGGHEVTTRTTADDSPLKGALLTNHTCYQDIVPEQRIVMAYTMSVGDYRISASLATIEFVPDGSGTLLIFTEQGVYFPNSDGAAIREKGWSTLLDGLGQELA